MFFGKNIKFLRKRKGRTQDDVAQTIDVKRPTLSGYENGVAEPGISVLIAFSDYYKISIDTLLRVDLTSLSESMLSEIERGNDVFVKGSKVRILATTVDSKNNENIELVPQKAKAGYTNGFADPSYIKELPTFQLPFLNREKKYRSFQISGDSMHPIPDGAFITGEFVLDWNDVKTNTAYIILTREEGIVFKVAENLIDTQQCLRLHSLNTTYHAYDLPVNEIREIWRFVHYISPELPEPQLQKDDIIGHISKLQLEIGRIKDKLDFDS
jgi:transcriptional regulator with XRE-family HTH domain